MPKSANDLLLAGKRLKLTLKQKMEISKVYQWAASACDWHARSIKEEAVLWQKYREAFSRSLEKGIKILTPRQRKLWRKSQLPDPKTPKPPAKCFLLTTRNLLLAGEHRSSERRCQGFTSG